MYSSIFFCPTCGAQITAGNLHSCYGTGTAVTGTSGASAVITTFSQNQPLRAGTWVSTETAPLLPKYSRGFWQAVRFLCNESYYCYADQQHNAFDSPFFLVSPMGMGLIQIQVSDPGADIIEDAMETIGEDPLPSSDLFALLYLLCGDGNAFPLIGGGSHDQELLEVWKYLGVVKKSSRATLTKTGKQLFQTNMVHLLIDIWRVETQLDADSSSLCEQVLKLIPSADWAVILTELSPKQRPYWAKKASESPSFSSLKA